MYYFIVNPLSQTGRALKVWKTVKHELEIRKITYEAHLTEYPHHAAELALTICNSVTGMKRIVVLGGDGTLNEVINGIPNLNEVILGYIPSGSSNDFARSLHIPKDPLKALDLILTPKHYEYVDIGELEVLTPKNKVSTYRRYAVSSGIGYDANVCYEALHSPLKTFLNRIRLGKLIYLLIAFKQIFTSKPVDGMITVDGVRKSYYHKILLAASMIHKYEGGGQILAPDALYNDHFLSVCLVHDVSRLKICFLMPTIIFGHHVRYKGVEIIQCKKLEVNLVSPMVTHTDGEYAGTNRSICTRCNRLTLRVFTPSQPLT